MTVDSAYLSDPISSELRPDHALDLDRRGVFFVGVAIRISVHDAHRAQHLVPFVSGLDYDCVLDAVFQKAEGTTEKKREYFNKGVPDDFSGIYELFGVVTHKGRDADSGHYIGWVRQAEGSDTWWRFDDDVVTEVLTAEIMALRGGGDWHTAYLNFYRASSKKR